MHRTLTEQGAVPRFVGISVGDVRGTSDALSVEISMEAAPAVVWDGVIVPDGEEAAAALAFISALTKHRHFERETDPPRV